MKAPSTRRPRSTSDNVKERILSTASALFYAEGCRAVGIDRVLAESGAAKASLYAHFESKDALVAAFLERRALEWRTLVQQKIEASGLDARGRILLAFDLLSDWIKSDGFRGCPFQNLSSEHADNAHPALEIARAHRAWIHRFYHDLVVETGLKPVDELAHSLVVLQDGAASAGLLDGDRDSGGRARWAVEALLDAAAERAAH